jgi:hypothetical protein
MDTVKKKDRPEFLDLFLEIAYKKSGAVRGQSKDARSIDTITYSVRSKSSAWEQGRGQH